MRRLPLLLTALVFLALPARAQELTVFAAASLTEAMKDISGLWQKQGHPALGLSFGSSSTLARQMEQGAPADLFASADAKWMDYAAQHGLIDAATRRDLLGNTLVLVVPKDRARKVEIGPRLDIAALLGPDGRLATGDPAHVPVGLYAAQALKKLGLWAAVEPRLAPAADVRSALLLVERGEAPAGIVYATDAAASQGVVVAGTFPESSHERINYPFAVTKASHDARAARALLDFIAGPQAREVFLRRGFTVE